MSEPDLALLRSRGWDLSAPVDTCHLDCADPGYLKIAEIGGKLREIILCPADATVLEQGAWHGDYSGAPTPDDSMATEWPWLLVQQQAAG